MKFDTPAGQNPIDQLQVIGKPADRIDGPLKTTGQAAYAYERHDVAANQAYGFAVGSAIAKGRVLSVDTRDAKNAAGVVAVLTTLDQPATPPTKSCAVTNFGGAEIHHYHQAVALVIAETFEQARAAAGLVRVEYERVAGKFDLAQEAPNAPIAGAGRGTSHHRTGDFESAFAKAEVTVDQTYTTPDESHAMMEPHASIAAWQGDKLTVWTSNQMIAWGKDSLANGLGISPDNLRIDSPFIGGGFGSKLFVRSDAVLAALGAKAAGRPVKVALPRPLVINNTTHRPATIQRIRLGATRAGKLTSIGHASTSGNLPNGKPETATDQTRLLYAAPHRETYLKLATLDLPEGHAMRAPGEGPGLMALEMAMDELAEKLGMDPVELRIINDTQVDPEKPSRPFSERHLVECLRTGAERFGWSKRSAKPAQIREGRWLIGMGVAAGFRNNLVGKSAARIRLERNGRLTVETDMTDIGTGSYTILAQTVT